jgi:glycosyltransferase involved in cell wall biosynthesis
VLEEDGHKVDVISPDLFRSLPCPTYPEIRLALTRRARVGEMIAGADPDALHIATEGPLGVAAQLRGQGLGQTRLWGRGVDLSCFHDLATPHSRIAALPGPIQLYVGRIAVEKNIDAFLATRAPGSKIVVGDGPALESMKRRHPHVLFLGALRGAALAGAYVAADVFVFPSRTDTFGLVMIEALACGTPVAAFPVPGPLDVVEDDVGCLDEDLDAAIAGALKLDRTRCAEFARGFSWRRSADQFRQSLVPIGGPLAQHVVAQGAPREPRGARTATGSGRAAS